jgi:hypothetical protein
MAKAKRPKFLTRLVPCTRVEIKKLQRQVRDALNQSSTHDPDHAKLLADHARWLVQLGTELGKRIDRLVDHVNREVGVASEPPLFLRVAILERQVQRFGAPQYRVVRKGKAKR